MREAKSKMSSLLSTLTISQVNVRVPYTGLTNLENFRLIRAMPFIAEERRQHTRYKLDNSVLVLASGIFQVTDVSRGGFCFRCPPYTSIDNFWKADILTFAENLEDFPGKLAWVSIPENGSHEFLPTVVGAKFGRLTKKQKGHLSQLIQELS